MAYCDLHMHSTASDGTDPPDALPRLVRDAGLEAFSLTDHDTPDGLAACAVAAKRLRIKFIPGIELSADPAVDPQAPPPPGSTLHLLGYGIDPQAPALLEARDLLIQARDERNPQVLAKLADLGIRLDPHELTDLAGTGQIVGRPHIAQLLLDKGYVRSIHEAFQKYLGVHGAAYARKDRLSAQDAITAIRTAGGLPVLAHPVQLKLPPDELEHTLSILTDLGLAGVETRHPDHRPDDTQHLTALAQRFGLLTTGGSDYHGSRKAVALGQSRVPLDHFDHLVDQLQTA